MKTKKIKVKKLYCGCASIRDYIVKKALEQGKEICVHFKDQKMTLTIEDLKNNFQFHCLSFKSKFGSNPYQLYDYLFKIDEEKKENNEN